MEHMKAGIQQKNFTTEQSQLKLLERMQGVKKNPSIVPQGFLLLSCCLPRHKHKSLCFMES